MGSLDFVIVLGVISAIITIVDAIYKYIDKALIKATATSKMVKSLLRIMIYFLPVIGLIYAFSVGHLIVDQGKDIAGVLIFLSISTGIIFAAVDLYKLNEASE